MIKDAATGHRLIVSMQIKREENNLCLAAPSPQQHNQPLGLRHAPPRENGGRAGRDCFQFLPDPSKI